MNVDDIYIYIYIHMFQTRDIDTRGIKPNGGIRVRACVGIGGKQ